jgi:hypothetical protein
MSYYSNAPALGNKLYDDLDLNGHTISGAGAVNASGVLTGRLDSVRYISTPNTIAAAGANGTLHVYAGAASGLINLPKAVQNMLLTVLCETVQTLVVNPDDNDAIILNGTTLAAGAPITSAGATGDQVTLWAKDNNTWMVIGKGGSWT